MCDKVCLRLLAPISSCVEKFKVICWVSSLVDTGATHQKLHTSTFQIITEKPQHECK